MGEGHATDTQRRPELAVVGAIHTAFFLAVGWVALSISSEFFVGPEEAAPLFLPLAVLLVGAVLAAARAVGGRPLLVAADLGLVTVLAGHLATTRSDFLEANPLWLAGTIVLGLLAAASTVLLQPPIDGPVARLPRDRWFLVLLIAADVASIAGVAILDGSTPGVDIPNLLAQLVPPTVGFDLAVFAAWWWGVRWPIVLGGAAGLLEIAASVATSAPDIARVAVVTLPFILVVAAGWVGPTRPVRLTSSMPNSVVPAAQPGDLRGGPLAGWIALGAVLWPLLVLFGLYPLGSDLCLECGPSFPGASLAAAAAATTGMAVPIAAGIAYLGERVGRIGRSALWILLVSGVLILFEILTGLLGVGRFFYLTVAASPAILVTVGSLAALLRPTRLIGGGWIAVLAAAVLVAVWTWSVHGGSYATDRDVPFVVTGLAQAALAGVGIAAESVRARRSRSRTPEGTTTPPPIDPAP